MYIVYYNDLALHYHALTQIIGTVNAAVLYAKGL